VPAGYNANSIYDPNNPYAAENANTQALLKAGVPGLAESLGARNVTTQLTPDQIADIANARQQAAITNTQNAAVSAQSPTGLSGLATMPVGGTLTDQPAFDQPDFAGGIAGGTGNKANEIQEIPEAKGGLLSLAMGGMAQGGMYNLGSYSDGGRLLRGPGDGVSDSIPATIGQHQPARLADGEFVIPARIVSELGNGSTEAGARKLYAMMDRVQQARGKTTGKNSVAVNSRADKHLPI